MKTFLLSFLFNLLFSAEFLLFALIALLLHIFLDWTIVIMVVILCVWVVIALLATWGLFRISAKSTKPLPKMKNVNPYSKSTKDFVKDAKEEKLNE